MAKVDNKSAYTFDQQPRIILGAFRLMCSETWFLQKYHRILLPETWSEMEGKWVIREVVAHYEEYGRAPKMKAMRMRLDADTKMRPEQEELVGRFLDKLDAIELDTAVVEYIDKNFEPFIRYRATHHALLVAKEYLQDGDDVAAVSAVQDSLAVRLVKDDWHFLPEHADTYFDYFSADNIAKVSVPVGLPRLNEKLGGGLRRGELGVVVASLGVGKSMALVHFGAAAYRLGLKVAHFSFENSWEETQARYMHNLLTLDSDVLAEMDKNHPVYNDRANIMDNMNGSLSIIKLNGSETSPIDLEQHLVRLDEMDKYPDLVLVDYADLMRANRRSARRSERWQELGAIYEELRELASAANVPLWTASQANREGMKASGGVRAYHVSGALGKLNVADVGITVSRETRDFDKAIDKAGDADEDGGVEVESEYRVWRVIKVRRGEDGWRIRLRALYKQAKFEEPDDVADMDSKMDAAIDAHDTRRKHDATD